MGIMSKSSRVSERPKPPSLSQIEDDLLNAEESDVALSVGEKHLQNINLASSCPPSQESASSSNTNSSNSAPDQTGISQSQIKESCDKVLRLIDLYSSLKDAPSELEDKISNLKVMGADMSESISQLKSLSQSISSGDDKKGAGAEEPKEVQDQSHRKSSGSKDKSKSKKKK